MQNLNDFTDLSKILTQYSHIINYWSNLKFIFLNFFKRGEILL